MEGPSPVQNNQLSLTKQPPSLRRVREMKRCRSLSVAKGAIMHQMLRLTIAALAVVFASFSTSALARVVVTQIQLTEKHVEDSSPPKRTCRR
jgi:hypothetical protein